VLLAVVLIVALVSVALLGFFPGMASDAQITQSKTYWQSASPIAITEVVARGMIGMGGGNTLPYVKLKNTGTYPIRITKVVGGDGSTQYRFYGYASAACGTPSNGYYHISDFFYLAPGEENYFSFGDAYATGICQRALQFQTATTSGYAIGGASSVCEASNSSPGYVVYKTFGFEYIEYIDGQQITKREIGSKPLVVKCIEPY